MGSGKSTIGKELAKALSWKFMDLDQSIVDQCNMGIPQMFEKYGERVFRGMEAKVLRSTMHDKDVIVATGGGAPCHHQNMQWLKDHGHVIYLRLGPEELYQRLKNESENRPLVAQMTDNELSAFVENHLNQRKAYYERAHEIVDGNGTISEIVDQIKSTLSIQENLT